MRAEPDGVIDPEVSLLSFWNGERPVAVLSYYACHPQSYYRMGIPSPDFPGIARFIRGQAVPEALHVHFNGAGGNIGAGKYNDGDKENRLALATRLADGMTTAPARRRSGRWSPRTSVGRRCPCGCRSPRISQREELVEDSEGDAAERVHRRRPTNWPGSIAQAAGHAIDIACLRVGDSRVLHLPGELFVEYQLAAKDLRPDLHVAMAAYGDYGPGYIGTTVAYLEGGYETSSGASNVGPEAEQVLMDAVRRLLGVEK